MSVFLLTTSEYSDYRVVGVFSTREKAEAAAPLYPSGPEIEEYVLDVPMGPDGWRFWTLSMDEEGDCFYCTSDDPRLETSEYRPARGARKLSWRSFGVWAKDEQHARKVANEKRIQIQQAGLWEKPSINL